MGHSDVVSTMRQDVQTDREADSVAATLAELILGGLLSSGGIPGTKDAEGVGEVA